MESILISTKKLLGIGEDYEHFDQDIILHINTVLMILTQMGIGPEKGFSVRDKTDTWDEFLPEDNSMEAAKSYVYLKVRILFDPTASSIVMEAWNNTIKELEWRLHVLAESKPKEEQK